MEDLLNYTNVSKGIESGTKTGPYTIVSDLKKIVFSEAQSTAHLEAKRQRLVAAKTYYFLIANERSKPSRTEVAVESALNLTAPRDKTDLFCSSSSFYGLEITRKMSLASTIQRRIET